MITVGLSRGKVERDHTDVESAATNTCRCCVLEEENGAPVYMATKLKAPIAESWPRTKHYVLLLFTELPGRRVLRSPCATISRRKT
jgi:hypothetical protein